jgi:hypothetical protein
VAVAPGPAGPTNTIFTTTRVEVHAENETSCLSLNTDDTPEQTAAILAQLAPEDSPEVMPPQHGHERMSRSPVGHMTGSSLKESYNSVHGQPYESGLK